MAIFFFFFCFLLGRTNSVSGGIHTISTTAMQHIPQCLHSALSLDGTLIGVQLQKRTLFFTLSVVPLVVLVVLSLIDHRLVLAVPVQLVTRTVAIATCICGVTLTLCKVPLNTAAIVSFAYVFAAVFMVSDLNARTYGNEFWVNLVLVVDFLLVMQVDATYSVGLMVAVGVAGGAVDGGEVQVWAAGPARALSTGG